MAIARPAEVLRWAWDRFGPSVAASSSFQAQSMPLLHLISSVAPQMTVLFLDTGYHFPETLAFRDRVVDMLGLRLKVIGPPDTAASTTGSAELYRTDPDRCCSIRKVEPLRRELESLQAWITGIRRDQTRDRSGAATTSLMEGGVVKICPLLDWTADDISRYVREHELPVHPLLAKGYGSVGCQPCTRPSSPDLRDRSGRWAGTSKTECGLHGPGMRRRDAERR